MKHFFAKLAAIAIIFTIFTIFVSCGKSKAKETKILTPEIKSNHNWYYFFNDNFYKTEKIALIPAVPFKPWTEAVRISSASVQSTNNSTPNGFAVVNRTGILKFNKNEINLVQDKEIFSNSTAGNLVFYNETPIFSVYKSTFFNNQKILPGAPHSFLIQFNTEQNICYPILTIENLELPSTSEITDFIWDGQYWTCSVKNSGNENEKIEFSYITFQPKEAITSIYPATAKNSIFITQTSVDDFRKAKEEKDFTKAPERIKKLLSSLPSSLQFSVTVYTAGGHSPRTFSKKNQNENSAVNAYAILSDTWAACLFSDGTIYMNGALYENRILRNGKTIGMKLPKLPSGFLYGNFVISGTTLYASWEETSFYKTARSGFISVDLNEVLYKNN